MAKKQWSEWAWDIWCIASIIGIWPRFIEPRLLRTTRLTLPISDLPSALQGLKILHFSDLHWHAQFSSRFQKKIIREINALEPDLILFTGDFLCRSKLENAEGLRVILESLKAPVGCFAVLGNHDYEQFVTINQEGDYDVDASSSDTMIVKGFRRLLRSVPLTKKVTERAQRLGCHEELVKLLEQTSFQLLNNTTKLVACNGHWINICGLGEYTLAKWRPDEAFKNYNAKYPGIILCHNPDTLKGLKSYPGDLILSGHTHGGQINLPWLWKRFTLIEHPEFKRGLKRLGKKWAYINRGISGVMKFRWFASPELTLITLGNE